MQSQPITIEIIYYKGIWQLAIAFRYNNAISDALIAFNRSYSRTNKKWLVPYNPRSYYKVLTLLQSFDKVDDSQVRAFFKKQRNVDERERTLLENRQEIPVEYRIDAIEGYKNMLQAQGYARSSVEQYTSVIKNFIEFHCNKHPKELDIEDARVYASRVIYTSKQSNSTQRQFTGAIKKYYLEYLNKIDFSEKDLPLPSKHKKLPTVLSENEVMRFLTVTKNLKHRISFALMYGCGLRMNELIGLKLNQIDIERGQLQIWGKGNKMRYVPLPQHLLPMMHNYLSTYTPKEYFLNGLNSTQYSPASLRTVFKRSAKTAGIVKKCTPHTLRHSFATHLLEQGVDVRYIQTLLGHAHLDTTMGYTHVARKDALQIKSPLDRMIEQTRIKQKLNENGNSGFITE